MWEFDWNGNLLIEKTTDFLKNLFAHWKQTRAAHNVTIVLFSRTFYDRKVNLHDFDASRRGTRAYEKER